ncbi:unnamed protein product [Symbiodinium sp. CCMP2592]|nr:unnamed protein product [Symbiodinium sp. CCMP2592]
MALRGSQYSAAYKKRLRAGLDAVLKFIGRSHKRLVALAQDLDQLDSFLEDFVNWVYRKCGRQHLSTAKHGLLAVQHLYPQHRRHLHRAWQSVQAWEDIVEVNVRVPLPLSVLCALIIAARAHAGCESGREAFLWDCFSVCLELAFFGLLRPGEVFKLRKCDVSLPDALLVSGIGTAVHAIAEPACCADVVDPWPTVSFQHFGLRGFLSAVAPRPAVSLWRTCWPSGVMALILQVDTVANGFVTYPLQRSGVCHSAVLTGICIASPACMPPRRPFKTCSLPALTAARLPLDRLGSLQSWVSRVWVVLPWQRVFLMLRLAAVLSRPHTHFLVARLLTRLMQQLLRYAMSLVIHLVEIVLEELVSQVQGRTAPERSDPTCPACQGLRVLGCLSALRRPSSHRAEEWVLAAS